ncbi:uncharacterized protein isoform X1 [Rhodnius prolixus]|uniref:uncharacterized protein isoform X1 n=1 Tax=Rhodnius prolixus TaxID=13249 RepID=UPI003D18980B
MRCALPELKKFLCCIQLEIGSKILAYFHLTFSIIFLIRALSVSVSYFKMSFGTKYFSGLLEFEDIGLSLQVMFGIYALIGLYEKSPTLLFAWVLFEASSILVAILLIIYSIIVAINRSIKKNQKFTFINPEQLIEECLFIVVYTYFCLVMNSLYKKMFRNKNDKEGSIGWRKNSTSVR